MENYNMFVNIHPENYQIITVIFSDDTKVENVEFNQKFLYKDGKCLGSCAIAKYWI